LHAISRTGVFAYVSVRKLIAVLIAPSLAIIVYLHDSGELINKNHGPRPVRLTA
jgi:hypothetical protein